MSLQRQAGQYLAASTKAGLLVIHSSPITLSWVPFDVVNDAYNVGGTVVVGTFGSLEDAKQAAREQYSVPVDSWQVSDVSPFEVGANTPTEIHTPEIDGHKLARHGIRWK